MKLMVVAVGRLKVGPERELAARYHERLSALAKPLGLQGPLITELSESPARSPDVRKGEEADALIGALTQEAYAVRLDERAPAMTSAAFAEMIRKQRDSGTRSLAFLIGGADGLDDSIAERAQAAISFGAMTLPHQLVRVLLLEQLYRAATILSGHPYHRV